MEKWYAIYTKPRQGFFAEENQRRQFYETFLPRIKKLRRRWEIWRHVIDSLLPRYLSNCLNLSIENIYSIYSTRCVSALIRCGTEPTAVSKYFIETLKRTANRETGIYISQRSLFKEEDSITIFESPLAGLQGIFQATKGEERIILLLDILGKANTCHPGVRRHMVYLATR